MPIYTCFMCAAPSRTIQSVIHSSLDSKTQVPHPPHHPLYNSTPFPFTNNLAASTITPPFSHHRIHHPYNLCRTIPPSSPPCAATLGGARSLAVHYKEGESLEQAICHHWSVWEFFFLVSVFMFNLIRCSIMLNMWN